MALFGPFNKHNEKCAVLDGKVLCLHGLPELREPQKTDSPEPGWLHVPLHHSLSLKQVIIWLIIFYLTKQVN